MKATIVSCNQSKSGKSYGIKYKTDQGDFEGLSKSDLSGLIGKSVSFEIKTNEYQGKTYCWLNDVKEEAGLPLTYGKPTVIEDPAMKVKTMLMAYAKDIVVACIDKGIIDQLSVAQSETLSTYKLLSDKLLAPPQEDTTQEEF